MRPANQRATVRVNIADYFFPSERLPSGYEIIVHPSRDAGRFDTWTATFPTRPHTPSGHRRSRDQGRPANSRRGKGREGIGGFGSAEVIELPSVGGDFFIRPWVRLLAFTGCVLLQTCTF